MSAGARVCVTGCVCLCVRAVVHVSEREKAIERRREGGGPLKGMFQQSFSQREYRRHCHHCTPKSAPRVRSGSANGVGNRTGEVSRVTFEPLKSASTL
eukprot:3834532-Rhodomonas_salina.2